MQTRSTAQQSMSRDLVQNTTAEGIANDDSRKSRDLAMEVEELRAMVAELQQNHPRNMIEEDELTCESGSEFGEGGHGTNEEGRWHIQVPPGPLTLSGQWTVCLH
ncbi:hypothetical protein HMI56_006174 [Coelomomyces lativittatus]|nr:hypothetical protein HMI56_006174 [Coelomomyces lativittatus]